MQQVEIFIGTSLRGPAKGTGKSVYIMRSILPSGKEYEKKPQITQADDATESHLVLLAIRDALQRMNYACEVIIRTECLYVANAINNHWMEAWQETGWKNSRNEEVKDKDIWLQILMIIEDSGHLVRAEHGKHEYSEWMRWNLGIWTSKMGYFSEPK